MEKITWQQAHNFLVTNNVSYHYSNKVYDDAFIFTEENTLNTILFRNEKGNLTITVFVGELYFSFKLSKATIVKFKDDLNTRPFEVIDSLYEELRELFCFLIQVCYDEQLHNEKLILSNFFQQKLGFLFQFLTKNFFSI